MLKRKDLLGLKDINKEEIEEILLNTTQMKKILDQNIKKTPHLQGKSIVTLFYENSTRTRTSFETAGKIMGANTTSISVATSSVAKGETLIDTGKTLDALLSDVIIIRHNMAGAPYLLSRNVKASVINAGDGMNEHPTQGLLDIFTMQEKFGNLDGLRVTICGDIKHSRVARSNIWGLQKLGAKITIVAPKTLLPSGIDTLGVKVTSDIDDGLKDANVVMGLRLQLERQKAGLFPSVSEYSNFYSITKDRLALADKDVMVMHPGPINRGLELSSAVADCDESAILKQVTNGVAVRMAVLFLLTRK